MMMMMKEVVGAIPATEDSSLKKDGDNEKGGGEARYGERGGGYHICN